MPTKDAKARGPRRRPRMIAIELNEAERAALERVKAARGERSTERVTLAGTVRALILEAATKNLSSRT